MAAFPVSVYAAVKFAPRKLTLPRKPQLYVLKSPSSSFPVLHCFVSFMPFVIALMTETVGATIIPASYQTNLMVCGPGSYGVADFVKMGLPLTHLVGVVTVILAPIVFPF